MKRDRTDAAKGQGRGLSILQTDSGRQLRHDDFVPAILYGDGTEFDPALGQLWTYASMITEKEGTVRCEPAE